MLLWEVVGNNCQLIIKKLINPNLQVRCIHVEHLPIAYFDKRKENPLEKNRQKDSESVADSVAALAEVRMIEADGYYIMGDGPEENATVAKERARADARRAASEQAGLYVASSPGIYLIH